MNNISVTDYPEATFGHLWIKKMRTLFRALDIERRRVLSIDNLLHVAHSLIANTPKLEEFKQDLIIQGVVELWLAAFKPPSASPGAEESSARALGASVNEAEFIDSLKSVLNIASFRETFTATFVTPFFTASDGDNDGKITLQEFKNLTTCWSASERDCESIFRVFDREGHGKMTMDEYHYMLAQFFYSEDNNAPTVKMWGPLVSYKRPEDYGEINCSVFWEGKLRNMFRRLDVSGTGVLRCHDILQIARSLIKRGHFNKAKTDDMFKAMIDLWVKYLAVDTTGKHFNELNEQTFVHNMRARVNSHHRHDFDHFGWTFFKAVESENNTGFITIQGYRNLQEAWNVSREEADAIFKILDKNKDGKISCDEYLDAFLDYFLGDDKNSCFKSFFGPIVTARHGSLCEE